MSYERLKQGSHYFSNYTFRKELITQCSSYSENSRVIYDFQGYNVHINGLFHCTVRYKQLHNLHEQLMKDLDIPLPSFPPKKFFPLTVNQQEDRRLSLDKYIQTIGQNTNINNSELLNGFLLSAQLESAADGIEDENIDVFLMNGTKINLDVSITENSGQILKVRHIYLITQ